ncbi:MAG: hypothetical protein RL653_709 [Pseudomonadota bacterium]|jgi:Flp pilus assembly protein TadD
MPRLLALALALACPVSAFAVEGPLPVGPTAAPPATSAADPQLAWVRAQAAAALAHGDSPRAAADVLRLHAARDTVVDLQELAGPLESLVSRTQTEPRVRALARHLLGDVERARGRGVRAKELVAPLGFLGQFQVLGGFDNEGKAGCDTDFGPEAGLDLASPVETAGRTFRWHPLPVRPRDGFVDLGAAVYPRSEVVAYALTFLEADKEGTVALWLGTSGAHRLWLNGERVSADDRYHPPALDQAGVKVRLRKGINRVLLKVCHASGPLGFFLRQEAVAGGGPLAREVQPQALPPLPKGPRPQPSPLEPLPSALARRVDASPADAGLRMDHATVLAGTRGFEETERAEAQQALRAAAGAQADAALLRLAAQLQGEDFNARRALLERARAAAPEDPLTLAQLAQLELQRDHPHRALELLSPLAARHPAFVEARLLHVKALEQLGETARAERALDALRADAPQHPQVVSEAARLARRQERRGDSLSLLRVVLALRDDDGATRRALASQLAESGRTHDAAEALETHLQLQPFDLGARLHLAELQLADGSAESAASHFTQARALSPEDPESFEREGRARLAAGDRAGGREAVRQALARRPQDASLREVLRALDGDGAQLGAEHALPLAPLLEQAEAWTGEDAVQLVENHWVRVQPSGLSSHFRQVAVKVLTQRGADAWREFAISWSPARQELTVLRARVQKPDGALVESFGDSERNMNEPWTGMYYDARARVLDFPQLEPGDVLELQYRVDDTAQDNLLSDYWGDVDYVKGMSPRVRYQYVVDMPRGRPLHANAKRLPGLSARTEPLPDGGTRHHFSAQGLPRVVQEPGMPGLAEVAQPLHLSTYETWEQVGRYYWGLVRDQLVPGDELRRTVDTLLERVDRKNVQAVVDALYGFVVTQTRYVALEFGIHGYKPYRVDKVLSRRFGDCKDKASLLHALLKVAGVDSRLVLLRMRNLGDLGDHPASLAAFNHAILYVPSLDLYLDGTAEFHGARELPSADRFANVLVVEPEGPSRYLRTPEVPPGRNRTHLAVDAALQADGSAKLACRTQVSGHEAPDFRRGYQSPATRTAQFEQAWATSFPGVKVEALELPELQALDRDVRADFALSVPRYAEVLDGGLRFHPLGTGRAWAQALAPLAERKQDVTFTDPFTHVLDFTLRLPAGYRVEELPAAHRDEGPFGRAVLEVTPTSDGALAVHAEFTLSTARVQAADYAAFRAWLVRADQAFNRRLVARRPATTQAARPALGSPSPSR